MLSSRKAETQMNPVRLQIWSIVPESNRHSCSLTETMNPTIIWLIFRKKDGISLFASRIIRLGIVSGLILPDKDEYDVPFHLHLTRKQTNNVKQLLKDKNHYKLIASNQRFDYLPQTSRKRDPAVFYDLTFRIVRFPISDTTCETVITNLNADQYPLPEIKQLYAMRWGIETLSVI